MSQPLTEREGKMWAIAISEFADIKASINVVLALLRHLLLRSGVTEQEIDQQIADLTDQYRADAQQYAKTVLAAVPPTE